MAAHLHLVVRYEEAKMVVAAFLSGEHKGTLMAVPCGEQAHRFAIEPSGVNDDRRRIAAFGSIAEYVDQKDIFGVPPIGDVRGCHGWSLPVSAACRAAEWAT